MLDRLPAGLGVVNDLGLLQPLVHVRGRVGGSCGADLNIVYVLTLGIYLCGDLHQDLHGAREEPLSDDRGEVLLGHQSRLSANST